MKSVLRSIYVSLLLVGIGFGQLVVKNSSQQPVMTVDDNGNATIIGKTTTTNLAITGNSPAQGKVPYSVDSNGNLRWSAQPTSTGQYLSWNASTHQWDVASAPTDNDNQGLSVGAGGQTTSIIDISKSSSDITLSAGSGIGLSENGSTITITNTDPGGPAVDYRIEHYTGRAGQQSTNWDNWVGMIWENRAQSNPNYVASWKTHRLWTIMSLTRGTRGTTYCTFSVEYHNGSSWTRVPGTGDIGTSASNGSGVQNRYDRLFFNISDSRVPYGAPLRAKVTRSITGDSDDSVCALLTGVHSNVDSAFKPWSAYDMDWTQ
ncbi:hypothetical protein GF406_22150 [candidate division KSB1 bacterium]|nr:hypothetical protein [candidate division KSB1 bacterium]